MCRLKWLAAGLAAALAGLNCSAPENKNTLFERLDSDETGIRFVNTVENTEDFNIFSYRNFYNGGGVAIGDVNNDGLPDVYLTSNMGENKLYLNKGDFQFEDITEKAGVGGTKFWSTGVVMVDINADGLLDLYVCNAGYHKGEKPLNELFINQGPAGGIPVFQEKAAEYGLDEDGYTTHAAFFDYDLDGDLDCYILNNSFMPVNTLNYSNNRELYADDWPVADFLKGGGDKLLRNDGPPRPTQEGGKAALPANSGNDPGLSKNKGAAPLSPPPGEAGGGFTDVTRQAGIFGSLIGFGLGVTVGDVNGDYWPDLYVSNDFYERDYLYINQRDGTFKEEIENWMQHLSHASMGADMADINNDGFPEIFTTEMLPGDETRLKENTVFENYNIFQLKQERGFYYQYMQNCLQLNNRDKTFSEIAYFSGVAASDWSWGALMFDADNDGYRDIYICNGIYKDVIDQDFIDFFADDVIQKMAMTGKKEQINEILNKMPSNPLLNKAFRNTGKLQFEDKGEEWGFTSPSFSNGAAYGDLDNDGDLDLVVNNVNQETFVYRNRENERLKNHYLSVRLKGKDQNTFAVGAIVSVHQNGENRNFQLVPSRGFQSSVDYKMIFGLGQSAAIDSVVVVWPDRRVSTLLQPPTDTTITLAWEQAGSRMAGNLYDVRPAGKALVQEVPCPFDALPEDDFNDFYQEGLSFRMLSREGPEAAVADVNGDRLDDVFIGGPAGQAGRLYLQTAAGAFVAGDRTAFEQDAAYEDTAPAFFDADADGDLDLFVGNRCVPGIYGAPPPHFLLENDGKGNFRHAAKTAAPDFNRLGMVTDAALADLTGDGNPELIVVGEWRNPKAFEIKNGRFVPLASNLDNYSGWWYAIVADDVDGDGDQDLILGNRGTNFYFNGSAGQPAKLWVGDFDQNGVIDKIMTRSIGGRDMPIPMKKELTGQIPSLKKQNLKHADYAKKSIQELFAPEVLQKGSVMMEGNYFSSAVALNTGNGQFTMQELPAEVQFSCVCAIWCGDLDGDGRNDLVLAGNDSGFMPQFSKLDAGFGHVLLNRGGGQYERVENRVSGFFLRGDVKTLKPLMIKGKKHLLATINGKTPRLFSMKW